jgi:hypothetical protein
MIRYTLTCGEGHGFESWFQNASAYEVLAHQGQLSCPVCGDLRVDKALMAPSVTPARKAAAIAPPRPDQRPDLTAPASDLEKAVADLRRKIEAESDYVGVNFVAEARAMHSGEAPTRSIYGEARPEEARQLLEEGVPVAPLPFVPGRKTN